jgi:hypothetical protein
MTAQRPHHPRRNGTAPPARRRPDCASDRFCPPHRWGCPVVMKLDPDSVAWTCAGCGSIVTVPVGTPQPRAA